MKKLFALLIALVLLNVSFSDSAAVSWKTFTDSRQVNDMIYYENEIWAATSGGALRFQIDGSGLAKYTNTEGLGSNEVTSLIAAGGYIWFGTEAGRLSRFDPSTGSWRVFALSDRDGNALEINDIVSSGDFLYLASGIGISKFDIFRHGGEVKETYQRLGTFSAGLPVLSVDISDGLLVAATAEGIAQGDVDDQFLQDPTHWQVVASRTSVAEPGADIVSCVMYQAKHYVATEVGLYRLDGFQFPLSWVRIALPGESISQMRVEGEVLTVTASTSLSYWNGSTLSGYDLSGFSGGSIRSSLVIGKFIVLGTEQEGVFIRGGDWLNVSVPGPASNQIVDLGKDSRGRIWCVVKEPYASRFDGSEWTHFVLPESEKGQLSLVVDQLDNAWIGTWQHSALRIDTSGNIVNFDSSNSSIHGVEENVNYVVIQDMSVDESGVIWFASYRGFPMRPVSFFDPAAERWDYYSSPEGMTDDHVQAICVADGVLWTGYESAGLFMTSIGSDPFDHTDISTVEFGTDDYLPSDNVRVIRSDLSGTVWVGTNAGLAYYDPGVERFVPVALPSGSGPQINALEIDPRNNLWIGTSNSLVRLSADGSEFEVFNTSNSGIAGVEVTCVLLDNSGLFWVGTQSGLSRLDYDIGRVTKRVEQVTAYPNPMIIEAGDEITYFNYDGVADVSIFTVSGDLVREVTTSTGWNGRNSSGKLVASGVYLFYIKTSSGDSNVGKIVVVRK